MMLSPSMLLRQQAQGMAGHTRRHCFRRMVTATRRNINNRSQSPVSHRRDDCTSPLPSELFASSSSRLSCSCENLLLNVGQVRTEPGERLSRSATRSWSSGIDDGNEAAVFIGNRGSKRGYGGGGDRRKSGSGGAISFLVGAALAGQAAATSENSEKGGGDSKKERSRSRRSSIKLERVLDVDAARVGCQFSLGDADDRSTISVWKVGERDDVTGAEEREDGEHVIVQAERRQHRQYSNNKEEQEEEATRANHNCNNSSNNNNHEEMAAEVEAVNIYVKIQLPKHT